MDALKQQIVQRLPYLRRYARALTGSQAVGDQYIRGCLETLLYEPQFMKADGNVSIQLFKLFHKFADKVKTSTDDIAGVAAARGILTALGGRTCHAAVVARQLNKVCLVGCRDLVIDLATRRCAISGEWLEEGDVICLDGHSGQVFAGAPQLVVEKPTAYLAEVAKWRKSSSTLKKSASKKSAKHGARA